MCNCGKSNGQRTASSKQVPRTTPRPTYLSPVPVNFFWEIYKELNPDLAKAGLQNQQQVMRHWQTYGYRENRKYYVIHLTPDFNWENYKKLNPDLDFKRQADYELHWIKTGQNENRKYKD